MRILLINQFFWPDAAATGQYLRDLACFLESQGHEVEVICGRSTYAAVDEAGPEPPVVCHRIRCGAFTKKLPGRTWSYLSFFAGALWRAIRVERPEVVVTLTTPPMLPVLGTVLKMLRPARHFIWEMDLFPEALGDVGLINESSWAVRLLRSIANWSRRRSNGVLALGDCMRRRLIANGIPDRQIYVAENWADGSIISPRPTRDSGRITVLYSGNLGRSHDIDTIVFAMEALKDDSRFQFRFVGGGPRKESLAEACRRKGIENVSFGQYCPRGDLSSNLADGDIGLVTQLDSCLGTVVPSKIYGLMAAGRPVLYIGPSKSTCAGIIERFRCGWQVDCGNGPAVVGLLRHLIGARKQLAEAGNRGRRAFMEHYDLPQGVSRIARIITASPARLEQSPSLPFSIANDAKPAN